MKKQIPSSVFFVVLLATVCVVGFFLYKQATDPLYHRDPNDQKFLAPGERRKQMATPEKKPAADPSKATKSSGTTGQ